MSSIQDLISTVAKLRSENGCPWDREQTHQSLCTCLIEECAELLDTIDRGDMAHMREELGDVLLQVVFHAQLANESGEFDFEAVANDINEKLIRRHPHVFGEMDLKDTDAVLAQWEKIKAEEKAGKPEQKTLFKELPPSLPALIFSRDVFKQLVKSGIDASEHVDREQINEMAKDLSEESAGEMLFNLAAACRSVGIDPESSLRRYTSNLVETLESESKATRHSPLPGT